MSLRDLRVVELWQEHSLTHQYCVRESVTHVLDSSSVVITVITIAGFILKVRDGFVHVVQECGLDRRNDFSECIIVGGCWNKHTFTAQAGSNRDLRVSTKG